MSSSESRARVQWRPEERIPINQEKADLIKPMLYIHGAFADVIPPFLSIPDRLDRISAFPIHIQKCKNVVDAFAMPSKGL